MNRQNLFYKPVYFYKLTYSTVSTYDLMTNVIRGLGWGCLVAHTYSNTGFTHCWHRHLSTSTVYIRTRTERHFSIRKPFSADFQHPDCGLRWLSRVAPGPALCISVDIISRLCPSASVSRSRRGGGRPYPPPPGTFNGKFSHIL